MFPEENFFETLNTTQKFYHQYENLGPSQNFAENHESLSSIKCSDLLQPISIRLKGQVRS